MDNLENPYEFHFLNHLNYTEYTINANMVSKYLHLSIKIQQILV